MCNYLGQIISYEIMVKNRQIKVIANEIQFIRGLIGESRLNLFSNDMTGKINMIYWFVNLCLVNRLQMMH